MAGEKDGPFQHNSLRKIGTYLPADKLWH